MKINFLKLFVPLEKKQNHHKLATAKLNCKSMNLICQQFMFLCLNPEKPLILDLLVHKY